MESIFGNQITLGSYHVTQWLLGFLAIGFTYQLILWMRAWQKFRNLIDKIPGPPVTNFLLGNVPQFPSKREDYFNFIVANKRDKMFRVWFGPVPVIVVFTTEAAEVLLSGKTNLDRSQEYDVARPILGDGLITSNGEKWEKRRKQLLPAFNGTITKDFLQVFNRQAEILVSQLKRNAGATINVLPLVEKFSLDSIFEAGTGYRLNLQSSQENTDLINSVKGCLHVFDERIFKPWLRLDWLFNMTSLATKQEEHLKSFHTYSEKVIEQRMKKRTSVINDNENGHSEKRNLSVLDRLLNIPEQGESLSPLELRTELESLLMAGFDTTSAAISWLFQYVGSFPSIQERINDELYEVFGDSDRPVEQSDLPRLKYLECCILETLRLRPSVSMFGRKLMEDTTINGYLIPAGCTVTLSVYLLHRNAEYYPNPDEFIPERFFPEEQAKRNPNCYVAFGAGFRSCIGKKFALMEILVAAAVVLRRFRLVSEGTDLAPYYLFFSKPFNGYRIKFEEK